MSFNAAVPKLRAQQPILACRLITLHSPFSPHFLCSPTQLSYIEHCQENYTLPGLVEFSEGPGSQLFVTLHHPSGTQAQVCMHGATVTSWRRADGSEMLYLRPDTPFNGTEPIGGGISIAWPQLGPGELPLHGILRNVHWSVLETSAYDDPEDPQPSVTFHAESADYEGGQSTWGHRFEALYTVTLEGPEPPMPSPRELAEMEDRYIENGCVMPLDDLKTETPEGEGEREGGAGAPVDLTPDSDGSFKVVAPPSLLRCTLQVVNTGDEPLPFTTGLLTHFATEDLRASKKFCKVLGLGGKYVLDYSTDPMRPSLSIEQQDFVFFEPDSGVNVDRLYVDCEADGEVLFCPGSQHHFDVRNKEGFADIEVIHAAGSAPQVARECVVVAPARKSRPVRLAPGTEWKGEVLITAYNEYWDLPDFEKHDPSTVPVPPKSEALPPRQRSADAAVDMMYDIDLQ